MPVYCRKISPQWRKAFAQFEALTGFEMLHQDAIDAGTMTPREAWNENIQWLEHLVADATNIQIP